MEITLKGRIALVTGGAVGLGKAISKKLAGSNATVIMTSRFKDNFSWINDETKELQARLVPFVSDVTCAEGLRELSRFIASNFKSPDILINNVGHTLEVTDPFANIESWRRVIDLNLLTHIEVTNAFLPEMRRNNYGRIVNITSIAGLEVSGPAPFNVSKAALTAYTRSVGRLLAIECPNIVMTAVAPGIVITEGGHWQKVLINNPNHADRYLKERTALGRFGTENEVTDIVVFLASDLASFFHGSIIQVDGGQSRHYMYHNYLD
jgi:3-oxoacyl-[acyl-carrier protein] reductase